MGLAFFVYFSLPRLISSEYNVALGVDDAATETNLAALDVPIVAKHIETPPAVRAIYMTQCVAGTRDFRERMVRLIEETEINSVVIDIKDYTGMIAFPSEHPLLKDDLSTRCHARDMREFITTLHQKDIYVIGRITVFQDPYYSQKYPHLAVQKESDRSVWEDYKGLSFIDPGAKDAWERIVALSKESYAIGFDELNFDYIRFPSDGNMTDIYFPFSEGQVIGDPDLGKAIVLREFFKYLDAELDEIDVVT